MRTEIAIKACLNRFGGYDLIPADSYLTGEAVAIGSARRLDGANEIVRRYNSQPDLLAACEMMMVPLCEGKFQNDKERVEMFKLVHSALDKAKGGGQ